MKARVRKRIYNNVNFFVVEIKHGYQKFDLAYKSEDKEESKWYANQFNLALKSHTNKTS